MKAYKFTFRLLKNDKIVEVDYYFCNDQQKDAYIVRMERLANALCIDYEEIK